MKLRKPAARELGHLLKESGIRWKWWSSRRATRAASSSPARRRHALITASRADRSSFGCADENDFTYFGRASSRSAGREPLVQDAFSRPTPRLRWERKDQPGQERSLPQIYTTPAINAQLQRWWARNKWGQINIS